MKQGIDQSSMQIGAALFLLIYNVAHHLTHVQSAGIQPTVGGWLRFGLL
jgi:hypothetical protein